MIRIYGLCLGMVTGLQVNLAVAIRSYVRALFLSTV